MEFKAQPGGVTSLSAHPPPCVSEASTALLALLRQAAADAGGWLAFDHFMSLALYAPGLGYYARGAPVFGSMPADGSDFITAPELSPFFGQALARQVAQVLDALAPGENRQAGQAGQAGQTGGAVLEFGGGSGALAEQLLRALGPRIKSYCIVEVSAALRQRQAERLAAWGDTVCWLDAWPERFEGVVLGNEVLDAMPVQLLHFDGQQWFERGVRAASEPGDGASHWIWSDRPTPLRPPLHEQLPAGTVTEIHPQAEAFMRSLAQRLVRGAAFFIDYGFPESEYYHPQRAGGTLMCHQGHRADADPLQSVGEKDITAHVNFSAMALTAQDAGLQVLGYTSQARFLLNCGLPALLQEATPQVLARAQLLLNEHEMGELFKVLALGAGDLVLDPIGFAQGDRCHML